MDTGDSQEEVIIFRDKQTDMHHNIYITKMINLFKKSKRFFSPPLQRCRNNRAGGLSTSDRIVEVDGVRLDSADHEKAVAAIQVGGEHK